MVDHREHCVFLVSHFMGSSLIARRAASKLPSESSALRRLRTRLDLVCVVAGRVVHARLGLGLWLLSHSSSSLWLSRQFHWNCILGRQQQTEWNGTHAQRLVSVLLLLLLLLQLLLHPPLAASLLPALTSLSTYKFNQLKATALPACLPHTASSSSSSSLRAHLLPFLCSTCCIHCRMLYRDPTPPHHHAHS